MTLTSLTDLIQKLVNLFDLFDLSFLVAGSVAVLAWSWLLWSAGVPAPSGITLTIILAIGAYINGLVCFSAGRWLRKLLSKPVPVPEILNAQVRGHDLLTKEFSAYLSPPGTPLRATGDKAAEAEAEAHRASLWRLYNRMWAELRERSEDDLKHSHRLINGFWVRAAIYDGLIPALVLTFLIASFGVPGLGNATERAWLSGTVTIDDGEEKPAELPEPGAVLNGARETLEEASVDGAVSDAQEQLAALREKSEALRQAQHTLLLAVERAEVAAARSAKGGTDSGDGEALPQRTFYDATEDGALDNSAEVVESAEKVVASLEAAEATLEQTGETMEEIAARLEQGWVSLPVWWRMLLGSPLLFGALFCGVESRRNVEGQVFELVATLAWDRDNTHEGRIQPTIVSPK